MGPKSKLAARALSAVAMASLMLGSANADIIITMTNNGTGGISVVDVGSGAVTKSDTDDDFDMKDFLSNFLTTTPSDLDAINVSGTLKNLSGTPQSVIVEKFEVDYDSGSNDDLAFKTDDTIAFITGNLFEIDFTAEYLSTSLAFSTLIPGTHGPQQSGGGDEIFGDVFVVVATAVPEPGTMSLLALGGLGVLMMRRRSSRS